MAGRPKQKIGTLDLEDRKIGDFIYTNLVHLGIEDEEGIFTYLFSKAPAPVLGWMWVASLESSLNSCSLFANQVTLGRSHMGAVGAAWALLSHRPRSSRAVRVKQPALGEQTKKHQPTPVCNVCQFLWCKCSHHSQFKLCT